MVVEATEDSTSLSLKILPVIATRLAMRLKLYCNRYTHFKDALVCAVNCVYRTRCRDFALYYDANRAGVDEVVGKYLDARRQTKPATEKEKAAAARSRMRSLPVLGDVAINAATTATPQIDLSKLISLEVKREMGEAAFIWIGADDRAEVLELNDVIRRAEQGAKAKHIYRVAQEMELRFQLVPRKGIERAKRAATSAAEAEQGRTAARRSRAATVNGETAPPIENTANKTNVTRLPNVTPNAGTAEEANGGAARRQPRARAAKVAGEK